MGKPATGDLLTTLTPEQTNDYLSPRGGAPAPGTTVTLWRLPGRWHVWSDGPQVGTWWLKAFDDPASRLTAQLTAKPSRGEPVVKAVWRDCIAVRSRDIRPGGR